MTDPTQTPAPRPAALFIAAGADRFGLQRGLGISTIAFKVTPQDSDGLLILENTFHAKGGPPRHLHYEQDEWFYAVEGTFLMEVGDDRMTLRPGDALLAPRGVPPVWASMGDQEQHRNTDRNRAEYSVDGARHRRVLSWRHADAARHRTAGPDERSWPGRRRNDQQHRAFGGRDVWDVAAALP